MNECMDYRSSYMSQLYKARNLEVTMNEKRQAALTMYENYICQYKALLLQCERDCDLMINVRLYHKIFLPFFKIKHGQYATEALTRRDIIILREQHKSINTQKKI